MRRHHAGVGGRAGAPARRERPRSRASSRPTSPPLGHHRQPHGVAGVGQDGAARSDGACAARQPPARALAGDLATDHDASRLQHAGIPACSITTGSACHLDAAMVHRSLHHFPIDGSSTSSSRTSATWSARRSTTWARPSRSSRSRSPRERTSRSSTRDVPQRRPRAADEDRPAAAPAARPRGRDPRGARAVMPEPAMLSVSALTGMGIGAWIAWLEGRRIGP
jgi:hydrogenase nickel incorporation protein HypB